MPPTAPDISIVVPTRNRAQFVTRTLASLLDSAPPDLRIEVIAADNGSTDATRDAIQAFVDRSPHPVRYVYEERAGVSHARNKGISVARAPIVAFCDDDQVVASDWTSVLHETLMAHPDVAAVGGRVVPIWSAPPPRWLKGRELSGPVSAIQAGMEPFRITQSRWLCLGAGNLAFRRATLEALGGFNPEYARSQDRELLVRLLLSGGQALYQPTMVVYHHIDSRRLTRSAYRRWYHVEGRMRAGYAFDELFLSGPRMRPLPADAPRVLGTAPAIYRRLLRECVAATRSALAGRWHDAFVRELRARYTWSYLRRRQEIACGGPPRMTALTRESLAFLRRRWWPVRG